MRSNETTTNADLALWAGAECTISRIRETYRDQSILSGHCARTDDLARFAALGIQALRYPLLWESFAHADDPERLWAWHDARLDELRALKVQPIFGLVHHGAGPFSAGLLDERFADGLAAHAAAAASRYPWVRDWTPVNEPLTTARFAALYGHWHPHLREDRAFWRALFNQVKATGRAMDEIRAINPLARLIQTEDLGQTDSTPTLAGQARHDNHRRWASWDLLCGRFDESHPFWDGLAAMGFESDLQGFIADPHPPDVFGINHYLTSDRFLDHRLARYPVSSHGACAIGPLADVESVRALDKAPGLEGAIRACWARYGRPIAITELHNGCTREEQMRWLVEGWNTALRLRDEGVAVEAVTVWSLLGAFDWDSLLTRDAGRYESGVFDVRGPKPRETALAPLMRSLAAGRTPDHPVLARAGWWRRHVRIRPDSRPILITGATGTLGQAFAAGCDARAIDYLLTNRAQLDLRDGRSMERMLESVRPWAVINCAGWVRVDAAEAHADDCIAANYKGAVALAEACRRRDIHYTCFSSDLVFDGRSERAYVETDATAPLNVYGESKARADAWMTAQDGRLLVVRTASFFSPADPHNFAAHLVAALRSGRPFRAASDCVTSPTFVPDLVSATLDLIIDDAVGLWHLANLGAVSWADFAAEIARAARLPANLVEASPADAMGWAALRPRHAPISSQRGLIMPPLERAIARFAETVA